MLETIKNVLALVGALYAAKGAIWATAKLIAYMTKTKKDDKVLSKLDEENNKFVAWASELFSTKKK